MGLPYLPRSVRNHIIRLDNIIILLVFRFVVALLLPSCGRADTPVNETNTDRTRGVLVVKISGVKEGKGTLHIALCRSSEEWRGEKAYFKTARLAATDGRMEYAFDDLADGEYAIKVFQDENDNHILDKDFMGVPLEGYGFSTAAPALFGPPPYHKAAFRFKGPAMNLEITLK